MDVVLLSKDNLTESKKLITENLKNNPIFVVTADEELCDYIPRLELKEKTQSRMRICKELEIDVLLKKKKWNSKHKLLSDLLKNIDDDSDCEIIVRGDISGDEKKVHEVRCQLCAIIQQLVYLGIQLERVHVCTEKEAKDNDKIRKFEKNIEKHKKAVVKSLENVDSLSIENAIHKQEIIDKLSGILTCIEQTQDNELRIVTAATKKAGKSVIVNSMIEYEIAPTSLELATPNNCIYRGTSDKKFYLKYNGEAYSSDDPEEIRTRLFKIFKKAEKDYENGLGVPDMDLMYPAQSNCFSKYVIYDTPGPNLANATAHKEAAKRGVDEADVIIFTIDYSKYLTDDEYKYLKEVWQLCQNKGKQYSLILNVNKLDLRFEDGDDKSVVRIVDFIRNKLINTGKKDGIDFRNCVVIGTSALTYFNAVTAPNLSCPTEDGDCRVLLKDFTMQTLRDCMDAYDDEHELSKDYEDRAISILQQLRGMIDKSDIWQKKMISSLQEMKEYSGMPNLLSYVHYISTQKARGEKVNNLLFKIDCAYRDIMNLFHMEELMQKLRENEDLYEKAIIIINEFSEEVERLLRKEYSDIQELDEETILKSYYFHELTKLKEVVIEELVELFNTDIDKALGFNEVLDQVADRALKNEIDCKITELYGRDKTKELLIDIVLQDYEKFLPQLCMECMSDFVVNRKEEKGKGLEEEQNGIVEIISTLWENRIEKLDNLIGKYSEKMQEECSEKLLIEIPEFQVAIGTQGKCVALDFSGLKLDALSRAIEEGLKNSSVFNNGKTDGLVGILRKYLLGKDKKVTLQSVFDLYTKSKLNVDIKGAYEKNGNLKNYLEEGVRNPLKSDMSTFVDNMNNDIDELKNSLFAPLDQFKRTINKADEYERTIEDINREKTELEKLKQAISVFETSWKEVIA